MVRVWLVACGVIAIGLVLFLLFFSRRVRSQLPHGQRLPLTDYVAVAGTVLNIAVLFFAVASLQISITTYQDAKRSGDEQIKALQASRRALDVLGQDLNKQEDTLEKSRQALDSSVKTAVAQQDLLSQSVANSKKQLNILQAQWTRELEQPDVHLALRNTGELSVEVTNSGRKVARDTLYQGVFWKLNKPHVQAFEWAGAKPAEVKYIRPGGGFAPTTLQWTYGNGATELALGDRLFGYMIIECPDCMQQRIYWVYFEVGGDGVYREGNSGEYSMAPANVLDAASKFQSSNGLIHLMKEVVIR